MFDARLRAQQVGIRIELADLGAWDGAALIAEYDHLARVIRINERALAAFRQACGDLDSCDVRRFIEHAVAHELYHHGEAIGEIERLPTRAAREAAATAFARAQVPPDRRLEAFLAARAPE